MTNHHSSPLKRPRRGKQAIALSLAAILASLAPFVLKRGCHFTAGTFKADFEPVQARTNQAGLTLPTNRPTSNP